GMCRDGTPATAHGNKRTIPAFLFVGRQPIEAFGCGNPPRFFASVDVARRLTRVAREPWTGVERPIRSDRVGVTPVNLARPHVDAVGSGEPALARLVPQKLHLLVHEVARVAHGRTTGASPGARHARPVQRLAVIADDAQRN